MNPAALGPAVTLDSAVLSAAAAIAEEALACHREALILLAEGWQSETGSAIADFMERQCVHGADVVDALNRVSGQLHPAPDAWTEPGSERAPDRARNLADSMPASAGAARGPAEPPAPQLPPGPAPGQMSPWMSPMPPPWTAPTGADSAWAGPPPGGLTPPPLPDLGGALVGLVAEIAQALGSYADAAPAMDPAAGADDPNITVSEEDSAEPNARESPAEATETTAPESAVVAAASPDPVLGPASAPVSPPPPPEPVSPAPSELLAAERPPDPEPVAAPAPVPDAPGPAPEAPGAETPTPEGETPCEIAADELPNVGE